MNKINFDDYFRNIKMPDNWDTLDEFVQWFLDSRMPIMVPSDGRVVVTDNATAVTIFKHKRYQIELYVVHPNTRIVEHSHPGIDLMLMQVGHISSPESWGTITDELKSGESHGGDNPDPECSGNGFLFLTFERWHDGVEMTSAAIQWDGETHGPIQDSLIKKHRENDKSV